MADIPRYGARRMSLSEKFSRLAVRLRNPEWRKYGGALFAGKGIGIALVLVVMAVVSVFIGGHALAADPDLKGNDIVNPVNTAWTLVAAFLVFGMQVGFTMLEAGFCRSRETVNVLVECVVDTCLCGLLFYAVGFAFMFAHGNGFMVTIGSSSRMLLQRMSPRASRFLPFGSSNSPSPIPARLSPLAP